MNSDRPKVLHRNRRGPDAASCACATGLTALTRSRQALSWTRAHEAFTRLPAARPPPIGRTPSIASVQDEQLGTGHAVLPRRPGLLADVHRRQAVVLYGDTPFITRRNPAPAWLEARTRADAVVILRLRMQRIRGTLWASVDRRTRQPSARSSNGRTTIATRGRARPDPAQFRCRHAPIPSLLMSPGLPQVKAPPIQKSEILPHRHRRNWPCAGPDRGGRHCVTNLKP
jgi:hypothetical protein